MLGMFDLSNKSTSTDESSLSTTLAEIRHTQLKQGELLLKLEARITNALPRSSSPDPSQNWGSGSLAAAAPTGTAKSVSGTATKPSSLTASSPASEQVNLSKTAPLPQSASWVWDDEVQDSLEESFERMRSQRLNRKPLTQSSCGFSSKRTANAVKRMVSSRRMRTDPQPGSKDIRRPNPPEAADGPFTALAMRPLPVDVGASNKRMPTPSREPSSPFSASHLLAKWTRMKQSRQLVWASMQRSSTSTKTRCEPILTFSTKLDVSKQN